MARFQACFEGNKMLRRKAKKRYLAILGPAGATEVLQKRHAELFGQIKSSQAAIKEISKHDTTIIRCSLDCTDSVLAAIAFCNPPIVALDMSGTIKRLKRRLPAKVNTAAGSI